MAADESVLSMRAAMAQYFSRLMAWYRSSGEQGPRAEPFEGDEPLLRSEIGEDGLAVWAPVLREGSGLGPEIAEFERRHSISLHPSLRSYLEAAWFLEISGQCRGYGVSLRAVRPGREMEALEPFDQYRQAHNGSARYVPIGIENDGHLVVVDNESGAVMLEDVERGSFTVLSSGISEMVASLISS